MPKEYNVCVPIAGHAHITVQAENEEDAKQKAMDSVTADHIDEWEAIEQFNAGNVCYCPTPWEIEADEA